MALDLSDPAVAERAYNPRVLVPEAPSLYEAWPGRAAATRARHPPIADIRYGPHPRELWDLFRVPDARGTVIFIHGGYWRAFSKDDFSWVADGFLNRGLSVAILNYPLCPEVTLDRIVAATRAAFVHLWQRVLTERERDRVVVTGHSAGGYMTALHLATDWSDEGLPRDPLAGAVPISGVFALAPLIATSMNAAIGLDRESAGALSLSGRPWHSRAPLVVAVGGDETPEFHRQSEELAAGWAELGPRVLDVTGANHFTILDGLVDPNAALHRAVMGMVGR